MCKFWQLLTHFCHHSYGWYMCAALTTWHRATNPKHVSACVCKTGPALCCVSTAPLGRRLGVNSSLPWCALVTCTITITAAHQNPHGPVYLGHSSMRWSCTDPTYRRAWHIAAEGQPHSSQHVGAIPASSRAPQARTPRSPVDVARAT